MISIKEDEFLNFVQYVKDNYGINLIEKRTLIETRLQNILSGNEFKSFTEYYDYIVADKEGGMVIDLVNKLTTNYTYFLRENDHFEYFKNNVLPYIAATSKDKDLRIWCAGCSTGEEPYTLAMIINDYFGSKKIFWDTSILATDISKKVLSSAVGGVYTKEAVDILPNEWKINYFDKVDDENYAVKNHLKQQIIFRSFNLVNEIFPFKKNFHAIFCRNVMIYFDKETKIDLVNKFYQFTESEGYLFIGHSESINQDGTKYKHIAPSIYRKE